MIRSLALFIVGGMCGAALNEFGRPRMPPDSLMGIVVLSDGTVKSGAITADDCARLAELAYDGKVFFPPESNEESTYAMAVTCAPEPLIKRAFGRRHTP